MTTRRRRLCIAAPGLALGAALGLGLAACAAPRSDRPAHSMLSYGRTFDLVVASMADHQMDITTQDRRHGNIVGTLGGDTVSASLQLHLDGTIRVDFAQQGSTGANLLQRVIATYNARLSASAHLLSRPAP